MTKVKSHFDRNIQDQVRQVLNNAKYSIRVAMYSLNEDSLFRLLCYKAEVDKIEVEVLLDKKQYEQNKSILTSSITRLENSGGSVFLYENSKGTFANMHNKFCIIDDKMLVTGSYNWTNNASNYSDENIVIIDDFIPAFEFGQKFNELKKKARLYNEDAELPIFLTLSKNVVKSGEEVNISWYVPQADTLALNGEKVENSGSQTKSIYRSEKFTLSALKDHQSSSKTISVTVAEKPSVIDFSASAVVIRRGQSTKISWEVKGATKVKIEQFGEVSTIGIREHLPQSDTIYKLIASDVWGEETIKELSVRVPDFKVPTFENVKILVPQISAVIALEIKKPIFSQSITDQTLKEMSRRQAQFLEDRNKQLNQIKSNRATFYRELKKNIREKSTQIRFNRIKKIVIYRTENVLNQLLAKLRESR